MSNIGLNMAAGSKLEKPLEIVFRPDQAVGIVYLRNPRNPSPEVEYLRQALPGVDVRRAALFTNASSTRSMSVGERLIARRISAVAASRRRASANSRLSSSTD